MLTSLAAAALPLLLNAAVKGTVLLLSAFVLALGMRRRSAASRHLAWALCMVGLLEIPLLSQFAPAWNVSLNLPGSDAAQSQANPPVFLFAKEEPVQTPRVSSPAELSQAHDDPALLAVTSVVTPDAAPVEPAHAPAESSASIIETGIVSIWLVGTALSVAWLLGGWLSLARLARNCERMRDGAIPDMLTEVAKHLGMRRRVHLLLSSQRMIPMTWGL